MRIPQRLSLQSRATLKHEKFRGKPVNRETIQNWISDSFGNPTGTKRREGSWAPVKQTSPPSRWRLDFTPRGIGATISRVTPAPQGPKWVAHMHNNQGCLVRVCQRQQVAYTPRHKADGTTEGFEEGALCDADKKKTSPLSRVQGRTAPADERRWTHTGCQSQRTVWQQQHTIGSETVHEQQRTDPYSPKTLDGKDVTPHVPAAQTPFTTPKDQKRPYRIDKWTAQLRPKQH